MKARKIIEGAAYGPDVVRALGQAFDEAWTEIADNFGSEPKVVEDARVRLAEAVLSVASKHSTDVAAIKNGALQAMATDYRTGHG
jgi:hypothetical protein